MFRIGIHLGDVVEESDGDLMGDGVNIAARLEGIAAPGAICLSEDAYRQVKGRLDLAVTDLGPTQLKNIAEPVRAYSLQVGVPAQASCDAKPPRKSKAALDARAACRRARRAADRRRGRRVVFPRREPARAQSSPNTRAAEAAHLSIVVLPFTNLSGDPARTISPTASPRISRPISRASATASSSPATPPSPTRARTSTPRRSARSLAFAMCSKARCSATRAGCASTRS